MMMGVVVVGSLTVVCVRIRDTRGGGRADPGPAPGLFKPPPPCISLSGRDLMVNSVLLFQPTGQGGGGAPNRKHYPASIGARRLRPTLTVTVGLSRCLFRLRTALGGRPGGCFNVVRVSEEGGGTKGDPWPPFKPPPPAECTVKEGGGVLLGCLACLSRPERWWGGGRGLSRTPPLLGGEENRHVISWDQRRGRGVRRCGSPITHNLAMAW